MSNDPYLDGIMAKTGQIPQSIALSEADPMSLNLLMSLDPEASDFVSRLPLIVQAYRAQAERFAQAEATGRKTPRTKKADSGGTVATTSNESAIDLDF
jgi:hypothetical protein